MGGCACGIIEASYDNERDAANYARMARERRADAERMIVDAERFEEKAKRLNNGGEECEPCEGRGAFDFMGDGQTEWEPCRECDGFGVTRALTCGDHSDITTEDLREIDELIFQMGMAPSREPREYTLTLRYRVPRNQNVEAHGWESFMAPVARLSAVRDKLPGSSDRWVAYHWAWKSIW